MQRATAISTRRSCRQTFRRRRSSPRTRAGFGLQRSNAPGSSRQRARDRRAERRGRGGRRGDRQNAADRPTRDGTGREKGRRTGGRAPPAEKDRIVRTRRCRAAEDRRHGGSSRLEAHVFGSVVLDNAADFFVGGPVDVGWIPVPHDDPPILDGQRHFPGRAALTGDVAGTRPPVDESPGISGILQDARHRRYRCSRPPQIAMTVAAREIKAALVQHAHDLGDGAEFQEGLEHKPKPLLYLDVGILEDDPARVAHQTDRQA